MRGRLDEMIEFDQPYLAKSPLTSKWLCTPGILNTFEKEALAGPFGGKNHPVSAKLNGCLVPVAAFEAPKGSPRKGLERSQGPYWTISETDMQRDHWGAGERFQVTSSATSFLELKVAM